MTTPARHESTNTMAVIAFLLSLASFMVAPACLGGVVCGHIARHQIRKTGERGDSWALAALIIGYLMLLVSVGGLILFGGIMLTMFGIAAFT
ncbi:DUF4190 domain-containing protein [Larsenimonas rhizosphaerae]|uniref:DUF4190 domain-containing protein n=1 Tax=Larsenimonas rhizosphaerae TaxID=2944682 RepID=A0AA42CUQ0_9GAMM|nr:DUF4190 domain-containing protein [Larsenimonas rhizosphaerae]MCM2131756.1 DUF4190 domain-containing protein [Larsenimonas rhizosphaerae]MCX2524917.1 DUF4190 domain-containing protein [Larsenimonas rhizosphaerae]